MQFLKSKIDEVVLARLQITRLKLLLESLARPLPDRYLTDWLGGFRNAYLPYLDGAKIVLDVGAGRTPRMPESDRDRVSEYWGLDVSKTELQMAPKGSYSRIFVADAGTVVPKLENSIDLAISYQVLEHVRSLSKVVHNLHSYLRPGGTLVALLSGAFSTFGLVNRIIPARLGAFAMKRLLNRPPDTVFPAYYDKCWYNALQKTFCQFTNVSIVPLFRGAQYWSFAGPIQRIYLVYEDWVSSTNRFNLATHYLITATK